MTVVLNSPPRPPRSMLDVGDDPTYQPIFRPPPPKISDTQPPPPISSSDEFEELPAHDAASIRQQKGLREVDAETLIAPILSRVHSTALYDDALSHTTPRSVLPSSEEDEPEGGVRAIQRSPVDTSPLRRSQPQSLKWSSYDQHKKPTAHHKASSSLTFSLPSFSLPRGVTFPSFASGGSSSSSSYSTTVESMTEKYRRRRAKTMQQTVRSPGVFSSHRSSVFFGKPVAREDTNALRASQPPPQMIRRSSSVSELPRLALAREMTAESTTSSLGDDTKFLHIQHQTNARFKAMKDNLLAGLPKISPVTHLHQHLASLNPFTDTPEPQTPPLPLRASDLEALDTVRGDVVILGGYRGSVLRDAVLGRRVWIPLKVGFNLRKVDLEVGLNPEDEERAEEKIRPDGMLKSISAVDISRRLFRRLRQNTYAHDRRVHDWGYDWRLSPKIIARKLIEFLETLPCNQPIDGEDPMVRRKGRGALVIAHSLGGLIVRNAINQRPELFSGVLFAGTPQTCINILGPLKNGDSVLFNSKVFTAQVNFTLRSSYTFLPESGHCFIDKHTGKPLPVDFFDINTWREYGLSPCVSDLPVPPPVPPTSRLTNASAVLHTLNPLSDIAAKKEKETTAGVEPQLNFPSSSTPSADIPTIPKSQAIPYLERTLADAKAFRKGLQFRPELEEHYPPMAVLYSKTTPTVRAAKVDGREGIKRPDVYEELAFGAGDGVCLARAAMLPEGYRCVRKVAVDRGHVSLLGELEGVGRCVEALVRERGW